MFRTIDAHHHLWQYSASEFGWIDESMAGLRRDFAPAELVELAAQAKVDATIAVQARESLEETRFLLDCSKQASTIAGVVGWAPIESPDLPRILESFEGETRLVGFREIAQGKAAGFFDRSEFNSGIDHLTQFDYAYDILVYENQLAEAARLVDRHPQQRFILDHIGKPRIIRGEFSSWSESIQELARRPNVFCKLSGMVTEASWSDWNSATLRPYFDVCVEAFGTHRLMAASDWPVCLLASSYAGWWGALREYFSAFTEKERQDVFASAAIKAYQLRI